MVRCIPSEKEARKISQNSRNIQRPRLSENFRMAIDGTRPSTHPIILKGNSSASLYAVRSLIKSSPSAGAVVRVAHDGVGDVSTSDIDLASTLGAIVLGIGGFYDQSVLNLAKSKNVRLETCASPQLCLERIESIALPMTKKVEKVIIGKALVKKVFQFPVEAVGCELISGIFLKQAVVSIMRGGVMIGTSSIANLRKYKKDVEEVKEGEFGVTLSDKLAVSEGDELISLS